MVMKFPFPMLKLMQLYIGHCESPSSVGYQGFGLELEVGDWTSEQATGWGASQAEGSGGAQGRGGVQPRVPQTTDHITGKR